MVYVGRCNMRDPLHRFNDRLLERGLRVGRVIHQVKTVGDGVRFKHFAVARGPGRSELTLITIGGLMQVYVGCELTTQRCDQTHQRSGLLRGTAFAE